MIKFLAKINWKPKNTGEGRFQNWLENLNDWNLSNVTYMEGVFFGCRNFNQVLNN